MTAVPSVALHFQRRQREALTRCKSDAALLAFGQFSDIVNHVANLKDIAKKLAEAHRSADPSTRTVKFFPNAEPDRICLLEVSGSAPTTGEILPFAFSASPSTGIDFASIVILVSPKEWQDLQAQKLSLPAGWDLSSAEDI